MSKFKDILQQEDIEAAALLSIENHGAPDKIYILDDFCPPPGNYEVNNDGMSKVIYFDGKKSIKQANIELMQIIDIEPEVVESFEQQQINAQFQKEREMIAAMDSTITLGDFSKNEHDSQNIYLETFIGPGKIRQLVGLHAIGYAGLYNYTFHDFDGTVSQRSSNFQAIEVWGNEYDSGSDDLHMIGRGSFRVHTNDIEAEAKGWEADGWVRCQPPKRKDENKT